MVKLSTAGKVAPPRVSTPELAGRIGQQVGVKASVSQVNAQRAAQREKERVAKIKKEVEDFNKDINYETYQAKYNALSSDAKAIVKSPAQVFATPEYKQYQKAVAEKKRIESENRVRGAYNETLAKYGAGMSSAKMVRRWGLSKAEQEKYMDLVRAEARVQDKMTRQQTGQISYADGSFSSEGIKFSKEGDIIGTFGLTQASAKDLMDWQTEYKASQQPKDSYSFETTKVDGNTNGNIGVNGGSSGGFLNSVRSRVTSYFGNTSDFKKNRQEKKDVFIPGLGGFASAGQAFGTNQTQQTLITKPSAPGFVISDVALSNRDKPISTFSSAPDFSPPKPSNIKSFKSAVGDVKDIIFKGESREDRLARARSIGIDGEPNLPQYRKFDEIIGAFEGVGTSASDKTITRTVPQFGTLRTDIDTSAGFKVTTGTQYDIAKQNVITASLRGTDSDLLLASSDYTKAFGRSDIQKAVATVPLVADIGIGLISIPAPLVGAAYFGGTAYSKAQSLERERLQGYDPGKYYEFKDGKFAFGERTYKESDILLRGSFALSGGLAGIKNIERSIISGELETLSKAPVKFGEVIFQGDDASIGIIKATQKSGNLKREFEITGKILREGDKISIIPTADGIATTSGSFNWDIIGGAGKPSSKVFGVQTFEVGSRAISGQSDDFILSISRDVIRPKLSMQTIYKSSDVFGIDKLGQGKVSRIIPQADDIAMFQSKADKSFFKGLKKSIKSGGDETIDFSYSLSKKAGQIDDITLYGTRSGKVTAEGFGKFKDTGFSAVVEKDLGLSGFELEKTFSSFKGGGANTPFSVTTPAQSSSQFLSLGESVSRQASASLKLTPLPKLKGGGFTSSVSKSLYEFGGSKYSQSLSPLTIQNTFVKNKPITQLNTNIKSDFNIKTILNTKTISGTKQTIIPSFNVKSVIDVKQDIISETITKQVPKTKQVTDFFSSFRGSPRTAPPSLFIPTTITPPPKFKLPGSMLQKSTKKQQGYIPQAKTKGGKWITLSKTAMTRQSALSRASRAVDNTTSAQFRIKKTKGKVVMGMDNYFGNTQTKYRPYKIRKGQKVELANQFIEKRGSRIDTLGEKRGLSLAKYAKQQNWIGQPPKKKKKTKSKRDIKKSPWLV